MLATLLLMVVIIAGFPLLAGYITLVERKVLADMQSRTGPMRVGPHGLLQPVADAIKLVLKEDVIPQAADQGISRLAPVVAILCALASFVVVPFASGIQVTDVNVGLLLIAAMGAVGILGVILGGWGSNSHYSLLGAMRSAAQLISYEVALSLALLAGVMAASSLSMAAIVEAQRHRGIWLAFDNYGLMLVPFAIFFVAAMAESTRAPFDLPEAESELVGGYHTEYSGFRWGLFMIAEYGHLFVTASVAVTVFWGGWLRPFPNSEWLRYPLDAGVPLVLFLLVAAGCVKLAQAAYAADKAVLLGISAAAALAGLSFLLPSWNARVSGLFWFFFKVGLLVYLLVWVRATFPRLRYDQLMRFGWKYLIPASLGAILVNAVAGLTH